MRLLPESRLVVEDVVADAARGCGAPARDEVRDPGALEARVGREVRVVRVVPGDLSSVEENAVACVGEPLPVAIRLRAVLRDRVARELFRGPGPPSRPSRSSGS